MKSLLKRGVFTLGAFLIVAGMVVVLDYAVRFALPVYDPSGQIRFMPQTADLPALGPRNVDLRQTKNTGEFDVAIHFNKYGLRDDRDIADAGPNSIIATGDSLSFGWGVEEDQRLSERLEKLAGAPVYNVSVPGDLIETIRLVQYARNVGAHSRILIVLFSTEARVIDYDAATARSTMHRKGSSFLRQIKGYLMENSAIYRLVTGFVHRMPVLKKWAVSAGLIVPAEEGIPIRSYDRAAIDSTARKASELKVLVDRVIMVIAPSRGLWLGDAKDEELRTHIELIDKMRGLGLEIVDLKPIFERGGDPFRYYFKTDGHWNPDGHAAAAETVAAYLAAHPGGGS